MRLSAVLRQLTGSFQGRTCLDTVTRVFCSGLVKTHRQPWLDKMSCEDQDTANGTQDPSPFTKPDLSTQEAVALLDKVYGLRITRNVGISPLESYDDQNFCVLPDEPAGGGHVLKVFRSGDGRHSEFVRLQSEVMAFLHKRGFPVPELVPTLRQKVMSVENVVRGGVTRAHTVWLLTLLEGTPVSAIPKDGNLCIQVGRLAASIDQALLEFRSPLTSCLEFREVEMKEWDLCCLPNLEDRVSLLPCQRAQGVVRAVIEQFRLKVLARRHAFRTGLIHGDLNDNNLLVVASSASDGSPWRISGLLDFGDMSLGHLVFELSIAIVYMMMDAPDPMAVGGHVLAGYESVLPLSEEERAAVFLVVLARLSQSALNAWHKVALYPHNEQYLMVSAPKALVLLCQLWDLGAPAVEACWTHTAQQYKRRLIN